ncbi:hypothetical protein Tco_1213088 [Tanacetum coccineum]
MRDANPIRTPGDYSKPSHDGYKNTIELPVGNNVVPLQSDTIRLVQNRCSFHGLRSEDPNQHLKDFLKLVNSLDLDGENKERTRLTVKLCNDILMFQQHHGESLLEAWSRFKDLLQKVPHHGVDLWLQVQIFYDHVTPVTRRTIDQSVGGKLCDRNAEESWALLESLSLYDNKSWNDPRDFAKPVKICSGPHDTQYCMENSEQAFVEYASSRTDEAHLGDDVERLWNELARLGTSMKVLEVKDLCKLLGSEGGESLRCLDVKLTLEMGQKERNVLEVPAHAPIYNAMSDKYVESLELGKNGSAFIQGEVYEKMEDPELFILPCRLGNSKPFDTIADLGSCVNIIPLYLFKKLNIRLLEETNHIFGLSDGTKSYPIRIVKKRRSPHRKTETVKRFLLIDCKKAKIAVGEGITRSVFRVKGVDLGEEEAPYYTTLRKKESYKPRPSLDVIGAQTPYYAKKDFLDFHLLEEWEIARDAEINPFKGVLVFRRMVEFLGALPINLKRNMWESEYLIENPINWDKPPKDGDGAWHAKIRIINPDGEECTKTLQSIPTTRKLSERETSDEELEGPMKDQPLSADASPTALSPAYIADSDLEEDKEDPEEDPPDYPADG